MQEQNPNYFDFTCLVSKNGKNEGMVIDFISVEGEMTANTWFFSKNLKQYVNNRHLSVTGTDYIGPQFETLEEDL